MDNLGQIDFKCDYKDSTMLTPTNMSFDHSSTLEYSLHHMNIKSPLEQLCKQIEPLCKQIEDVKDFDYKQKSQIANLEKEVRKYKDKEQDWHTESKKLKTKDYERKNEIDNLNTIINQLKIENSQVKQELASTKSDYVRLKTESTTYQTESIQTQRMCDELQKENEKRSKDLKNMNKILMEKDQLLSEQSKMNSELILKHKKCSDELNKRLMDLKRSEESFRCLDDELKILKQQKQDEDQKYKFTIESLNAKLETQMDEIQEMNSSFTELNERIENLKREKSFAENQAKSYRNQVDSLKRAKDEKLDEKTRLVKKYTEELNVMIEKTKELNLENKSLKESKMKQLDEIVKLKETLDDRDKVMIDLKEKMNDQLNHYKNQLQDADSKISEQRIELNSYTQMIDQLNVDCQNSEERIARRDCEICELKEKYDEQNTLLNRLEKECSNLESKLRKLTQEKTHLSDEFNDIKSLVVNYNETFQQYFKINSDDYQSWCESTHHFTGEIILSVDFVKSQFDELISNHKTAIQVREREIKSLLKEYEEKLSGKDGLIKQLVEDKVELSNERDILKNERSQLKEKNDGLIEGNYHYQKQVDELNKEIWQAMQECDRLQTEKLALELQIAKQSTVSSEQKDSLDKRSKPSKESVVDLTSNMTKLTTNSQENDTQKKYSKSSFYTSSLHKSPGYFTSSPSEEIKDINSNYPFLSSKNLKNSTIQDKSNLVGSIFQKNHESSSHKNESLFSYKNKIELERKNQLELRKKAEEVLKEQGYYEKKNKMTDKPEVCFNLDNLKLQEENRDRYKYFKEHLDFADSDRTKTSASTTDSTSIQKQTTMIDQESNSNNLTPSSKSKSPNAYQSFKKPSTKNNFLSDDMQRKSEVQFTSTPISKNTRVRKLHNDYRKM